MLPVCAVDPDRPDEIEAADPLAVISRGPVIDLLAFSPAAPRRCALRLGTASVLGAIEPQYLDPEPLPVWRDVIGWLRAGCRGLVLLTNDPFEACSILQRVTTIAAEDEAHKRKLEKLLAPPRPTTTSIAIGRVERRAA